MFCPDCGNQTPEGKRFCIHCGTDLAKSLTPTPVPAPPGTPPPTPAGSISDEDTAFRADSAEVFRAGDVIDERYEVKSVLGKGGMGAVYLVHDRHLGEECALKAMHPHLLASEKAAERFVQEVRVSRRLSHANIVRVHGLDKWGGLRYLTMELLDGITLRDWLRKLQKERRQVSVETAASIAGQVLEALVYAHKHTIHRDIKPENIFLAGDDPGFRVKLLDFGIAKAMDVEALTSTTTSMGTAYYVAPEQLRGEMEVDPRADLYAVGVVLYELLTGRLPTGVFPKPSEVRSDLGQEWDRLILGAMEQEPTRRPRNAAVMADGLRALLQARKKKPVEEKKPRPMAPPKRPARKPQPVSGPLQRALLEEEERRAKTARKRKKAGKRRTVLMYAAVMVAALAFSAWALREHWLPQPELPVEQEEPAEDSGESGEARMQELRDQTALWVKEAIADEDPVLARQHLGLLESYGGDASRLLDLEGRIDDLENELAARQKRAQQKKEDDDYQARLEKDRLALQERERQKEEEGDRRIRASRNRVRLLAEATTALDSDNLELARQKVDEYLNAGGSWSEVSALRKKIEDRAIALRLAEQERLAMQKKKVDPPKQKTPPPVILQGKTVEVKTSTPSHAAGESLAVDVGGVEFIFRWAPPGTDRIGSPVSEACREDDERQWTATFEEGFWIGETEVTRGQWRTIMGHDPSGFDRCDNCPVETVSWEDAQAFIDRLNNHFKDYRFRLPYEAEWEYAARAGSDGPFNIPCGQYSVTVCDEKISCLDSIGWYKMNSGGSPQPVTLRQPNAWGLYDMHGNVLEWCQDYCGAYPSGPRTDWMGPESGNGRILRGGSWLDQARFLRSANRSCNAPTYRFKLYGFRLVYEE